MGYKVLLYGCSSGFMANKPAAQLLNLPNKVVYIVLLYTFLNIYFFKHIISYLSKSHRRDSRSALSVIPAARRLLSLHCNPNCEELLELQQMEECLHGAV